MEKEMDSIYDVPDFVYKYCKNRQTEIFEYLTQHEYQRLLDQPFTKVRVLEVLETSKLIRCKVIRPVLPLTVMRSKLLFRAAELEAKTCHKEFPIALQEARYILLDEFGKKYPDLNTITQPMSVINLIRRKRGQFRLELVDALRIADERRKGKCTASSV
jgi:hypothetical protein